MNYQSIEIDEDYAWVTYRNRGHYPMDAKKGVVIDKRKEKKWHNKNLTGQVLMEYEGEEYNYETREYQPTTKKTWIDAYNVIDYWDRYEDEREHKYGDLIRAREKAEQERLARLAQMEEERKAREEERKAREAEVRRRNLDLETKVLRGLSLPAGSVTIMDNTVVIDRSVLEQRLGERIVYD